MRVANNCVPCFSSLPTEAIQLIEGLSVQTPPRSATCIHRQVTTIAKEQWWKPPSYNRIYHIIKNLDSRARLARYPQLYSHAVSSTSFMCSRKMRPDGRSNNAGTI